MKKDLLLNTQKANTEFGQMAKVTREDKTNDLAKVMNESLRKIGFMGQSEVNGYEYQGSMALHVYKSPLLNEIIYINQTSPMQHVPEIIASKAFENLKGDLLEFYGRSRQVKRSGF